MACALLLPTSFFGGIGCQQFGVHPTVEFNSESLLLSSIKGRPPATAADNTNLDRLLDLANPRSVLAFVLTHCPMRDVVRPTERYYYFRFRHGTDDISGNIRFVEAENGGFSIGYFNIEDTRNFKYEEFNNGVNGVGVRFDAKSQIVSIDLDDLHREFRLDREALDSVPPELLDGEQFVSGVRDESGYFLHLIYNEPQKCFYFQLNNTKPIPENWSSSDAGSHRVWFGSKSGFCFFHDKILDRYVLVGVSAAEIRRNSWFDGPFDQVPPRLPIYDMLMNAYPYVVHQGGIDAHGNFVKLKGQRVAICPYIEYERSTDLVVTLTTLLKETGSPSDWTRATYEAKHDWQPSASLIGTTEHSVAQSGSWPANHFGANSAGWITDHRAETSLKWPANHDNRVSNALAPK